MKNKNLQIFMAFLLFIVIGYSIFASANPDAKESITYFPIDKEAIFLKASNSITIKENVNQGSYSAQWKMESELNQRAYLRQDIGFLYSNGILAAKMNKWGQNVSFLKNESTYTSNESSLLQSVGLHYAEIHGKGNGEITSAQRMSQDQIYAIQSKWSRPSSFRVPSSNEEKQWKNIIDQLIQQKVDYWEGKTLEKLPLQKQNNYIFLLTEIPSYNDKPLPGFTKSQSDTIIGNLWEGLYKNYFLGIKLKNGTIEDPLGSTVPIIFLDKNRRELLVAFLTKSGESIELKQKIPAY
ncbi:hypothetical protein [Falsibacillus pallidus]|uniref:Uncharacterized protein n=1 Tax=Falsibacillus pallidus TaxID=493781 RepID=A0A370GJW6_9BACI|nr:hypothetical protein [Falsibacillus pallidus]RDI43951.1 hypothetical protein DFR59_10313 [Falsibacillus pallidus]